MTKHHRVGLACAFLAGLTATPAQAAIVMGTFSGEILAGAAQGNYGYAYEGGPVSLTGKLMTGTVRYDTGALGGPCQSSQQFQAFRYFGCFLSNAGVTITHTIEGVTETFNGAPADMAGLQINAGRSGLLQHILVEQGFNLATLSMIGAPTTVYSQHQSGLALFLEPGTITDAWTPLRSYRGGIVPGAFEFNIQGLRFGVNEAAITQLTRGNVTQNTSYQFSMTSFALATVPEPTTWAFMLTGFGLMGAAGRHRASCGTVCWQSGGEPIQNKQAV